MDRPVTCLSKAQAPVLTNRRWDGRLLAGDEILVQVMRDALKTKRACPDSEDQPGGAAGSSRSGRRTRRAVFQAAPKETADHFREVLQSVTVPDGMTLVVRTAAGMLWIQPFYARQTLFSKRRRSF